MKLVEVVERSQRDTLPLSLLSCEAEEEVEEIVKNKPDTLIVRAGTNVLNNFKKLIKLAKLVFSSLIVRKDIKNIDKRVLDTNPGLRNFCNQKNIDYIDDTNIKEDHQGNKKLHLNKGGNSVLAKN